MIDQQQDQIYLPTQDTQQQVQAFSHIKKDQYLNKVFCWIQQGDTKNVIKFYNTFPHLLNQLYTPNHWNPLMYAVRYGIMELIEFLYDKGMKTSVQGIYNQVSIIHSAIYSGEISILSYVLSKSQSSNPNPPNCQTSPLKVAMKSGNPKMVQILISKGAYYTFGDVYNNLLQKQSLGDQSNKFIDLQTKKDINNSLVVEDSTIKDCPIKETLRWARIRQPMFMKSYAEKMIQMKRRAHDQVIVKEEEIESIMDQQQQQPKNQAIQLQQPVQATSKSNHQDVLIVKAQKVQVPKQKQFDQRHKFYSLAQILLNDDYYNNILKVLVGRGDSILIKNDPVEQKQPKQPPKDSLSVKDIRK